MPLSATSVVQHGRLDGHCIIKRGSNITISLNTHEPCLHNEINECDEIENCLEDLVFTYLFLVCNADLPSICRMWSCKNKISLFYSMAVAFLDTANTCISIELILLYILARDATILDVSVIELTGYMSSVV